ncbi:MAG: hypothetical protein FWB85_07025 [Chitinispirillia bacterium]|nr:hypothetical protein [Chitinispirillia bacterium]MCL2241987.1 hypothetical protein [Chitinispirillia bacterium]
MNVKELAGALGAKIVQPAGAGKEVSTGYTSDLLSDVMANAEDGCALITIQAHLNTVAVATHVEAAVIVVCNNHPIPADMVAAAEREEIAVIQTGKNQFEASHLVYVQINGGV